MVRCGCKQLRSLIINAKGDKQYAHDVENLKEKLKETPNCELKADVWVVVAQSFDIIILTRALVEKWSLGRLKEPTELNNFFCLLFEAHKSFIFQVDLWHVYACAHRTIRWRKIKI